MGVIVHKEKKTLTTGSGTVSTNINVSFNKCRQIIVEAATSGTTFNVKLTDVHDLDVYNKTSITGKLNDHVELLTYGNWTLTIYSASADEEFSVLLIFEES